MDIFIFLVYDPVEQEKERKEKEEKRKREEEEKKRKEEERIAAQPFIRSDYDEYENINLGENRQFYKNSQLILKKNPPSSVPEDFYFEVPNEDSGVTRQIPTMSYLTKATFKVIDTTPRFILKDIETEQLLYYRYDTWARYVPFLVKDMEFTEEAAKHHFSRSEDEINKKLTISSPFDRENGVQINKEIVNNRATYYLTLMTQSSTLTVSERGVKVLFDDGTIWSRNANVNVSAGEGSKWNYSSFINLTNADMQMFSKKKIKKYELYIHQDSVSEVFSEMFPAFVKAILTVTK